MDIEHDGERKDYASGELLFCMNNGSNCRYVSTDPWSEGKLNYHVTEKRVIAQKRISMDLKLEIVEVYNHGCNIVPQEQWKNKWLYSRSDRIPEILHKLCFKFFNNIRYLILN